MDEQPDRDPVQVPGTQPLPDAPPPGQVPGPPPGPPAGPPPAQLPGPPPVMPAAPGGVYPAAFTPEGAVPATSRAPRRRRRGFGLVAGIGVGLVALLAKFGLPLLVGVAVSGAIGTVFGGAYGKLPSDQQHALEARFDAAIGDRIKGMPDAEATATVNRLIESGMPRLADEPLVEKLHLTARLLTSADQATCARIARTTATGTDDGDAVLKALDALDVTSVGRWYEINIQALEAEAASKAVRSVDAAAADRVLRTVLDGLSSAETAEMQSLYGSAVASDPDACGAIRAFYRELDQLPPGDIAAAALYDVSP